jgi:hypothetical protein
MVALAQFWQHQHRAALTAAKVVAEGKSKGRDFARYIVGQIYHAEGGPAEAIVWYRKVAGQYADAKQAIDYFERKHIALEEVSVFRPGKPVQLTLNYRNIKEAFFQVYSVDLMKLYLREKNLSNITKVNLAGIEPLVERTIKLGDGKDYMDKEETTGLALEEEGAYLVICRGDDLFASGMVLITPLTIEVQEDAAARGRFRPRARLPDQPQAAEPERPGQQFHAVRPDAPAAAKGRAASAGRVTRSGSEQPGRKGEGVDKAFCRRHAFVGDIERRAVVDRSADYRQAERDVDRALEIEQLDRDVALVVVHADHGVEPFLLHGLVEDRVGGEWALDVDSLLPGIRHGRGDLVLLLPTEHAVLACMGVQTRHADAGAIHKMLQGPVGQLDHLPDPPARDQPSRFRHWHVR